MSCLCDLTPGVRKYTSNLQMITGESRVNGKEMELMSAICTRVLPKSLYQPELVSSNFPGHDGMASWVVMSRGRRHMFTISATVIFSAIPSSRAVVLWGLSKKESLMASSLMIRFAVAETQMAPMRMSTRSAS